MILDKTVQQLFENGQLHIRFKKYWHYDSVPPVFPQFYRGVATRFLNKGPVEEYKLHKPMYDCRRHMQVYKKFNIIPEYCFDCYKIAIEPKTVIELFKLMILFEKGNKLYLPNDNTRKCMVEFRPQVPGTYKGFIYSRDIKEAENILQKTQKTLAKEINKNIPLTLKRGCTEFSQKFPRFSHIDNGEPTMAFNNEWKKIDDNAYENDLFANYEPPPDTYNHSGYNMDDGLAMLTFIKYAATIGDESYLKITNLPIIKFNNLKR